MFYNAMRCSGVGALTAKTMYYTLVRHGRHWKHPKVEAVATTSSAPPAPDDEIQKWIKTNDPSLDQIEARARLSAVIPALDCCAASAALVVADSHNLQLLFARRKAERDPLAELPVE